MGLFHEIRERRILPAVGVYVGACWVLIEILDRLSERYFLSPYLTDIVFWGLYSLIPAVILMAWTHGRPGKDETTRVEKVGVSTNIILTLGLLLTVFGGKDLNATADLVTVSNELGQHEEFYVPRESYRRRLAVFFFDNESDDPGLDWMQYAVTEVLVQDLSQNPFIVVSSPWENQGHAYYYRLKQAGFSDGLGAPFSLLREVADKANRPFFVNGSINRNGADIELSATVWETETLREVGGFRGQGRDLLTLAAAASDKIRDVLDVPVAKGALGHDLPLAETYGESEIALKQYINGLNAVLIDNDWDRSNEFLDAALAAESDFVLAWVNKGMNQWEQGDATGARISLSQAQRLAYRLSERDQARLKGLTYRIAGEQEKLEKLLRMQIEVHGDVASVRDLARMLMLTGQIEESRDLYKRVLKMDSSDLGSLIRLARLEQSSGNFDSAISYAGQYIEARPEDLAGKLLLGDMMTEVGDLAGAQQQFEEAQLLEDPPVVPTLRLSLLAIRKGEWARAKALIEEVRSASNTAQQASLILEREILLELRLGRIERAIELTEQMFDYNRLFQSPVQQVFNYYLPLSQYNMVLGRLDQADEMLSVARDAVSAPLDQFLAFMEAILLVQQGDTEQADAALQVGIEAIKQFKAEYLAFQIDLTAAEIAGKQNKHSEAARLYQSAMEKALATPVDMGISNQLSLVYGTCAQMYVKAGELDEAHAVLGFAFKRDEAEPSLWVARAMLQSASGNPQMAFASINYALAIWADADPEYIEYRDALAIRDELAASLN